MLLPGPEIRPVWSHIKEKHFIRISSQVSSLLLLTNPNFFSSPGSSQNHPWKHVDPSWHSVLKSLQWLILCFASVPNPTPPAPVSHLLPLWSCSGVPASLVSSWFLKQATCCPFMSRRPCSTPQQCPPSPSLLCRKPSFSVISRSGISYLLMGWDPLVPLSCSRQIFPSQLLLWLEIIYWCEATWGQRWNHPIFFCYSSLSIEVIA